MPGKLLLRLAPSAVSRLGERLPRGSVLVSATNGKTTTAGMMASVLGRAGIDVAHNRAGANMPSGVATALLEQTRPGRSGRPQLGLFEVDEAWVETLVDQLAPHTIVFGNLFRDQLDRYGELEKLADDWATLVATRSGATRFVLNADDPLVADLGRDAAGGARPGVVYFGVEDTSQSLAEGDHAFDAKHCRRCGEAYRYSAIYLGHLGIYACPRCGSSRPRPSVFAERIELHGMEGSSVRITTAAGSADVSLSLPGLYNVYNALAATACCLELGISLENITHGLESFAAAFGRAERLQAGSRPLSILLVKNPAGANEVFRTLVATAKSSGGQEPLDLLIALNDGIADGRDISWIWDADFEILAGQAGHVTCSGSRADELALRLKYSGVPVERLEVVPELEVAFERSLQSNGARPLYALPTYTALLELRELVADRGYARRYWEEP
jgi:UDP-N-acetylmuramyl tripeptide synthase